MRTRISAAVERQPTLKRHLDMVLSLMFPSSKASQLKARAEHKSKSGCPAIACILDEATRAWKTTAKR